MMTEKEYMDLGEQYFIHTYNRFPVVIEKGEDVYVYDVTGKKYLDFAAGIAVSALGYSNDAYKEALNIEFTEEKLVVYEEFEVIFF